MKPRLNIRLGRNPSTRYPYRLTRSTVVAQAPDLLIDEHAPSAPSGTPFRLLAFDQHVAEIAIPRRGVELLGFVDRTVVKVCGQADPVERP